MYVFENEKFKIEIIKYIHEFSFDDHANKTIIYDRFNQHYY